MSVAPSEHIALVTEDEVTFKYAAGDRFIGGIAEYVDLLKSRFKVPFTKSVTHRNGEVLRLKVQLQVFVLPQRWRDGVDIIVSKCVQLVRHTLPSLPNSSEER